MVVLHLCSYIFNAFDTTNTSGWDTKDRSQFKIKIEKNVINEFIILFTMCDSKLDIEKNKRADTNRIIYNFCLWYIKNINPFNLAFNYYTTDKVSTTNALAVSEDNYFFKAYNLIKEYIDALNHGIDWHGDTAKVVQNNQNNNYIALFDEHNGSLGMESNIKPLSLWKLDSTAVSCSKCKTKFTMLNRKHHCRYCGEIFCDSCAPKRENKVRFVSVA